jgi:TonB family protein
MLARETLPRPLRRVMVGSFVVHAAMLVALALQGMIAAYFRPERPKSVITTKLVKLGTKRDEQLLPRLQSEPPPAAPPKPVPAPLAEAAAVPAPPKQPAAADAKERLQNLSRVSNALNRVRSLAEDTGDPDGVPDGDANVAIAGSKYATEIYQCMKRNYIIEGVPQTRLAGKTVTMRVRVQNDGRLFDYDVIESSGEPAFDGAVTRSVQRCGKVSAPPQELRRDVHEDGIEIVFHPT